MKAKRGEKREDVDNSLGCGDTMGPLWGVTLHPRLGGR